MKKGKGHTSLPEPPEPGHHHFQNKDWMIVIATLLVLALAAKAGYDEISGKLIYQDYGYGGGFLGGFNWFNFSSLYASYGYIIDAALFLLIFLGVVKGVFKKHFGEGGTAAYIGIGIFLAFALLLWEEKTGFFLLQEFGPFVMLLFSLVLCVGAYKWLHGAGLWWLPTLCLGYLIFYYVFYQPGSTLISDKLFETISFFAMGGLVISLLVLFSQKKEAVNTTK